MKHTIRLRDIRIRTMTVLAAAALCVLFAAPVRAQGADDSGGAPPLPKSASPEPAPPSAAPTEPPQHPEGTTPASKEEQVKAPPGETTPSNDSEPTLGPETTRATLEATKRYANIADAGGWPRVGKALRPGSKGNAVVALRRRLAAEGELSETEANGAHWNDRLTDAVKHFQFRLGLPQTGLVSGTTLREMNIPAAVRARQLAATAERLARKQFPFGPRYVVVNIPAAGVEAVDDGKVIHRYTAIAGEVDHPSPEIVAKITAVNINPTWTVPVSIIKDEMVPKIRKDSNYLSRAHIRLLDSRGHEVNPREVDWSRERSASYTFRQDRGPQNSLGSLRISMPNKHDVYMHDTPKQKPFARVYRFLSHGCVRVEGVYDLAVWLLEGAPGSPTGRWDQAAILQKIAEGKPDDIRLTHAVPVIWVYLTGWASADGIVHFRNDIYGMDKEAMLRPGDGEQRRFSFFNIKRDTRYQSSAEPS
jgi:murein L,D-transpeptidase YcbB/YkuD